MFYIRAAHKGFVTNRIFWESEPVDLEQGGPQGKKARPVQGTLTDSGEFFPQSNTQTEAHRAEEKTPVH